jgi:hypothetical protein
VGFAGASRGIEDANLIGAADVWCRVHAEKWVINYEGNSIGALHSLSAAAIWFLSVAVEDR